MEACHLQLVIVSNLEMETEMTAAVAVAAAVNMLGGRMKLLHLKEEY